MIIDIFGIISEDYWEDGSVVSLKSIRQQLQQHKEGEEITVYINSPGGSVFEGLAIYNLLAEKNITVKIIGEASSIASVIACAGKKIMIAESAVMLFHKPWTYAYGNENDIDKIQKQLKTLTKSISTIYQRKTGLTDAEIENLLNEDTYHGASDCKGYGFVDEVYVPNSNENAQALKVKKILDMQMAKFYNMKTANNNFLNKGDISNMEWEKLYNEIKAKHDVLSNSHEAVKAQLTEKDSEIKALKAGISQSEEVNAKLKGEIASKEAAISAYKQSEIENNVKIDIIRLQDKIPPSENCSDNNFALQNELIWLRKFDGDESAKVNGKSPYARKIAEIEARESLASLEKPLNPSEPKRDGKNLKNADFRTFEGRNALAVAAMAKSKAENITFEEAADILIQENS